METTTYLYSKSNKKVYEQVLEEVASTSCRHTPLVIAAKDFKHSRSSFLDKHLIECVECQTALRSWEEKMLILRNSIPYKKIDNKDLKLLSAECFQLAEQSKELKKLARTQKRNASPDLFKNIFLDVFKSTYSLTMLKGMFAAFLSIAAIYLLI